MKKDKKPPRLRRWLIGGLFALIALFVIGLLSFGYIRSRVVLIDRTTVYLEDLPDSFDGKTILFVSDIDMVGSSGPGVAKNLFKRLQKLNPDILILGGDYAGYTLMNRLNSTGDPLLMEEDRREFFSGISDFYAPMGKFAIAGENDLLAEDLAGEMTLGGITLLSDSAVTLTAGTGTVYLIGLKDYTQEGMSGSDIAANFSSGECVIVAAHNPASIGGVVTSEAKDTGQWCDLMLTGHTHHGQAVVGERSLLQLSQQETRFDSGWSNEGGVYLLVSPGLGCETVNLRLGTTPQIHLITLRKKQAFTFGQ